MSQISALMAQLDEKATQLTDIENEYEHYRTTT